MKRFLQVFAGRGTVDHKGLRYYVANLAESAATTAGAQGDNGTWLLKGVEVFAAGTWRKVTYTQADLDQMVANFNTLRAQNFEPPFKVDHDDLFRPESARDVSGYVVNLYRDGDMLKADLEVTEEDTQQKIKRRTWRKLSAEIYMPKYAEKVFPGVKGYVFRAVSVVAVPELKHIKGLVLNSEMGEEDPGVNEELKKKIRAQLTAMFGETINGTKVADLPDEKLEEFAEEMGLMAEGDPGTQDPPAKQDPAPAGDLAAQVAQLTETVKTLTGTMTTLAGKITGMEGQTKAQTIATKLSAYKEAGKILPAQIADYTKLAEGLTDAGLASLWATLDKAPKVVELAELGTYGADQDDELKGQLEAAAKLFGAGAIR